jgi:hypothetical protein
MQCLTANIEWFSSLALVHFCVYTHCHHSKSDLISEARKSLGMTPEYDAQRILESRTLTTPKHHQFNMYLNPLAVFQC